MYQYTEAFCQYSWNSPEAKKSCSLNFTRLEKKSGTYGRLKNCAKKMPRIGEKNSPIRMTLITLWQRDNKKNLPGNLSSGWIISKGVGVWRMLDFIGCTGSHHTYDKYTSCVVCCLDDDPLLLLIFIPNKLKSVHPVSVLLALRLT